MWIILNILANISLHISPNASNASFFEWKLSATKLQGIHWPNYRCKNDWWVATASTWNFESNWQCWSEIADFRSNFAAI